MKLIKQLHENQIVTTAKQKTYEDVKYAKGFTRFLESLVINNLISSTYKRTPVGTGIRWDDQLFNGGVILETDINPLVLSDRSRPSSITVTGNKDTIEIFEYLLRLNEVEFNGDSKPQDIVVKAEYHETLNPDLWDQTDGEYTLLEDVSTSLDEAATAFYEFLDMPKIDIIDITITGSSANFNWTSESDIDLHIIVDLEDVENDYGELAQPYFNAQRKLWNEQHDITIKGIPVEFYVQDINEPHHSTGIYSIMEDKWVVEPKKEKPELDFSDIRIKAARYMNEIDSLLHSCNKAAPIEKMMDKLIKMRKAGLEEAGEFSTENYVYKVLRNEGYIDKLADCKTKAEDRELSIEEEEWEDLEKDDPWADIGYTRKTTPTNVSAPPPPTDEIKKPVKKTRINLNVPYSQRESAKRMGAKWDAGLRKWYMYVSNEDLKKIPNAWR